MSEKYGLVLEGGGMRGAYTAGALAWLSEQKFIPDYSVGISSGAVYLVCYLTDNQVLPYNMATKHVCDPESVGVRALLKEHHLVAYGHLFKRLVVDEGLSVKPLKELNPDMEIGVYDLKEGETIYLGPQELDDGMQLLLASTSLPIAGKRVTYEGKQYLDGGISKMIPIERSVEKGCTKHLVITTKPEGYVRKKAGWLIRTIMRIFYHDCPGEIRDYEVRHINYANQIGLVNDLVEKGDALLLRPSRTIPVSRFRGDPEDLKALYQLGYDDAESRKEEILAFLGLNHD